MHSGDRTVVMALDWRRLRAELRPILQDPDAPSTRAIERKTGVVPSTLTRWSKDTDDEIDLNRLALVLDCLGGITLSELLARIDGSPPRAAAASDEPLHETRETWALAFVDVLGRIVDERAVPTQPEAADGGTALVVRVTHPLDAKAWARIQDAADTLAAKAAKSHGPSVSASRRRQAPVEPREKQG